MKEFKKYKPKYHKNIDTCTENCEKDCNMECDLCRATPWDTNYYYIIEGKNHSIQLCEKCYKEIVEGIKNGKN